MILQKERNKMDKVIVGHSTGSNFYYKVDYLLNFHVESNVIVFVLWRIITLAVVGQMIATGESLL